MESKKQRRQFLFSNILKLMQTESFPDCKLVTQERIAVEAHKIILFQVPYLRNLLTSISCCEGQCGIQEPVTILLPDVSYTHLEPILHYLYTGVLKFPKSEKAVIRDLLLKTFGVPGERVSPTSRPGDVTCDECSERVHVTNLFQHMTVKHVKEPFLRDIQFVEGGGVVDGIEAFDETDAIKSVTDHYSNRFNDMLSYLQEDHGIANQLGMDRMAALEMWLEEQRGSHNRKSKPSTDQFSSIPKNTAAVPENVDKNRENLTSVENRLSLNFVISNPDTDVQVRPDLEKEANVRGIKRRRKSKMNGSSTPINPEEIKSTDDRKNSTNVQGSKRRRKSQTNLSKKPEINSSTVELSSSEEIALQNLTAPDSMKELTNHVDQLYDEIENSQSKLPQTDGNNLSLEPEAGAQGIQGRRISNVKNNSIFVSKANKALIISSSTEDPSLADSTEANTTNEEILKPRKKPRWTAKEKAQQKRIKSSRLSLKKKAKPAVASLQNNPKPGKVICQECKAEVSRQVFSKHLVAKHLFKLWTDVKENETVCKYENCKKVVESSKYLIQHLALTHNEVEAKLREIGKSLSDYEWTIDDKDDKEEGPTKDTTNSVDNEGDKEDNDEGSESGSDATMPLGFEEKRMEDFDD